MSQTLSVQVTRLHIDDSTKGLDSLCPIERSLAELVDKPCYVGYNKAGTKDGSQSWALPSKARSFMIKYDLGEPVEPETFELEETNT